jgi:hypothetical protein
MSKRILPAIITIKNESRPHCCRYSTRVILPFLLVYLQGCSSGDKAFDMKEINKISPVIMVDCNTVKIEKYWVTFGDKLAASAATAANNWAYNNMSAMRGTTVSEPKGWATRDSRAANAVIPNLGQLVTERFIYLVEKEVPGWPKTIPYSSSKDRQLPILMINVSTLWYGRIAVFGGRGFESITTVTMTDCTGEVLWRTHHVYWPEQERTIEQLEADDFRLLKEEINGAAEETARYFFADFKGDKIKGP